MSRRGARRGEIGSLHGQTYTSTVRGERERERFGIECIRRGRDERWGETPVQTLVPLQQHPQWVYPLPLPSLSQPHRHAEDSLPLTYAALIESKSPTAERERRERGARRGGGMVHMLLDYPPQETGVLRRVGRGRRAASQIECPT
jgi:hypothetical protein